MPTMAAKRIEIRRGGESFIGPRRRFRRGSDHGTFPRQYGSVGTIFQPKSDINSFLLVYIKRLYSVHTFFETGEPLFEGSREAVMASTVEECHNEIDRLRRVQQVFTTAAYF